MTSDLDRRVRQVRDRALMWIIANLQHFALPPGDDPGDPDATKAFAELALLHRIARRYPPEVRGSSWGKVFAHLAAGSGAAAAQVRRTDSLENAVRAALVLEAIGADPESYRPHVSRAFRSWTHGVGQSRRWNLVELTYYLDALGVEHHLPAFPETGRQPALRTAPDIGSPDRWGAYEITHTIFCVSDFGRVDALPVFGGRPHTRLCIRLNELTTAMVHQEEWDLVAELLASSACVRHRAEGIFDVAWAGLADAQSPSGHVLARSRAAGVGPPAYRHHTTTAALLAAVLALGIGVATVGETA
jgi:hypothetical protein